MAFSDVESVRELSNINAEFAEVWKPSAEPAEEPGITPSGWRSELAVGIKARTSLGPQSLLVKETTRDIPMRDGYLSNIRIFDPSTSSSTSRPLCVLIHGGGFISGSKDVYAPEARAAALLYDAVAVTINYRLAPEHPFPTAVYDAYDTIAWLAAHASDLGADPLMGFVLVGESAGGNLAAASAVMAKSEGLFPPLTGVGLSIPLIATTETVPESQRELFVSREQNANAPALGTEAINTLTNFYNPDPLSPLFSPLNADQKLLAAQPPTYFQVCGLDPMRDDGLVYERLLRDLGVPTRLDAYSGVPHAVWHMLPTLTVSRKAITDLILGIGWLLKRSAEEERIREVLGQLV